MRATGAANGPSTMNKVRASVNQKASASRPHREEKDTALDVTAGNGEPHRLIVVMTILLFLLVEVKHFAYLLNSKAHARMLSTGK